MYKFNGIELYCVLYLPWLLINTDWMSHDCLVHSCLSCILPWCGFSSVLDQPLVLTCMYFTEEHQTNIYLQWNDKLITFWITITYSAAVLCIEYIITDIKWMLRIITQMHLQAALVVCILTSSCCDHSTTHSNCCTLTITNLQQSSSSR